MKNIFAIPLVTFSSYGWAQQLAQVQPQSDSTFGLFVIGIVAVVGGLVYLKLKRPETFARLLGVAKKVEHEAVDAYHTVSSHAPSPGAPPSAYPAPTPHEEQGPGIHPLDAKIAALQAQIAALQPPPRDPREDQIAELEAQLAALKPPAPPPPTPEDVAALQQQLDAFRVRFPGYDVNGKPSAPPPIGGGAAYT